MKLILSASIILLFFGCSKPLVLTGYWTGALEMNGKTVDVSINFDDENSYFSCNDLMLLEIPINNLLSTNDSISFSINPGNEISFNCLIEGDKIVGSGLPQGAPPEAKMNIELSDSREGRPIKTYTVEELTIESNDALLSAQIFKPKTDMLHPAIVLLHGSSTNLKEMYTFDADFFARLGFEVLIFDKRGNGESSGDYKSATLEDFALDAIACLKKLQNKPTVNKDKIGIWGFSQGAILLPNIVNKTSIPSFLIAKSPGISSSSEEFAYQDSLRVVVGGSSIEDGHIVAETNREVAKMIKRGCDYQELQSFIIENAKQYPFMNLSSLNENVNITENSFKGHYWQAWIYNSYPYWKNLNTKTLVLIGEDDEYINSKRTKSGFMNLANENIEIKVFPRADHSLRKTINPAKYADFDFPRIIDGYMDFLEEWVNKEIINNETPTKPKLH